MSTRTSKKKFKLSTWIRWQCLRRIDEYKNDVEELIETAKKKSEEKSRPSSEKKTYADIVRICQELEKHFSCDEEIDIFKEASPELFDVVKDAKILGASNPPPELETFQKIYDIPFPLAPTIENPPPLLIASIQNSPLRGFRCVKECDPKIASIMEKLHPEIGKEKIEYDTPNNTLIVEINLDVEEKMIMAELEFLLKVLLPERGPSKISVKNANFEKLIPWLKLQLETFSPPEGMKDIEVEKLKNALEECEQKNLIVEGYNKIEETQSSLRNTVLPPLPQSLLKQQSCVDKEYYKKCFKVWDLWEQKKKPAEIVRTSDIFSQRTDFEAARKEAGRAIQIAEKLIQEVREECRKST